MDREKVEEIGNITIYQETTSVTGKPKINCKYDDGEHELKIAFHKQNGKWMPGVVTSDGALVHGDKPKKAQQEAKEALDELGYDVE